jgi:hypothetical protein
MWKNHYKIWNAGRVLRYLIYAHRQKLFFKTFFGIIQKKYLPALNLAISQFGNLIMLHFRISSV